MRSALNCLLILSLINADSSSPCPEGYTQAANGGDCYNVKVFKDNGKYRSLPFSDAETGCNDDSGGLLATIHSQEENDMVFGHWCDAHEKDTMLNIGLRCDGKACQWDDGSPVTYTNFAKEPTGYDNSKCFGMDRGDGKWKPKMCNAFYDHDCWACRVKAKSITCTKGETEYKGGCVSVHKKPLDQKSAEASCPGGGHLISIHGTNETDRYSKLARDAGINGTIHLGGTYTKDYGGAIEWIDGSNYNVWWMWAKGFPNTFFGSCVQMLLDSEFGAQGQWTNVDCTEKLPYICFRDGAEYPTEAPQPKADPQCPATQYITGNGITIYSPNFPYSIPGQQSCEYVFTTTVGIRAGVSFPDYDCKSGYSLLLYNGVDSAKPFINFTGALAPSPTESFLSQTNVLKIVFTTKESPVGTGWEANLWGSNARISDSDQ